MKCLQYHAWVGSSDLLGRVEGGEERDRGRAFLQYMLLTSETAAASKISTLRNAAIISPIAALEHSVRYHIESLPYMKYYFKAILPKERYFCDLAPPVSQCRTTVANMDTCKHVFVMILLPMIKY